MLQDQLQLICRAPDILLDPQMEGLASGDPTAGRGMNRSKPTATMAMMNQDQRPSAAAAPQQALKCPRCDSTNTKFCYYNNYSQTQPRHFCKSCRRYWTQGGSLRNVPVGGGCRKNKRVKPRSLMNLSSGQYGGPGGLLDPNSLLFDDSSTSHMLARLSNISSSLMGAPNYNGEDQLLNIAFSRFQESCMRHSQLQTDSETSPEGGTVVPYFDMGYPTLVQKPACPSTFDNHLAGLTSTPESDSAYRNPNSFGVNPNFHNMDVGTSATATLASIEDQLSTFSNLQQPHHAAHEQPFHAETHTVARDNKTYMFGNAPERSPLQLLLAHGASSHHSASVPTDQERHSINTELCDDPNWQQPTFMMSEMSLEAHNHHSHNLTSSVRWQDMMQSLYSNTAAATTAGSVL